MPNHKPPKESSECPFEVKGNHTHTVQACFCLAFWPFITFMTWAPVLCIVNCMFCPTRILKPLLEAGFVTLVSVTSFQVLLKLIWLCAYTLKVTIINHERLVPSLLKTTLPLFTIVNHYQQALLDGISAYGQWPWLSIHETNLSADYNVPDSWPTALQLYVSVFYVLFWVCLRLGLGWGGIC